MLKKRNRTLLEIQTAAVFWTVVALVAGLLLPLPTWGIVRKDWCLGISVAGMLVLISMLHMLRCLERGLEFEEGTATKIIFRGYLIRYVALVIILVVTTMAELLNPVIVCLGYLLIMKVAVYSQPITHKFYNKLFHETDPIPEPLVEEEEVIQ